MNTYKPNHIVNMRKALSLSVAALLILTTIVTAIPLSFAAATTTPTVSMSPSTVTAKTASDLTISVTNPSTASSNYAQIQIRLSGNWTTIASDAVTPTSLGGTASVSISGQSPSAWVVTVSGISLAPSAGGTVKLAGMIASVGPAGSSYNDTINVLALNAVSGDTISAAVPLTVSVTVSTTTATRMNFGMEPKIYTMVTSTLTAASTLKAAVQALVSGTTGTDANVTLIVVGRDNSGNSLIGHVTIPAASNIATTAVTITTFNAGTATFKSVESVWIKKSAGIAGYKFNISTTGGTSVITGIETRDSTFGILVAGQSINIAAYVTDNNGKGVSGASVSFSDSAANSTQKAGGTYSVSSVTTDAMGAATTVFTTDTAQGTTTLTATSSGLLGSGTTFKITTVWGTAVSLTIAASPTSIPAVSGSTTITAKLVDANGNTIKLATTNVVLSTSLGTLTFTNGTALSSATTPNTLPTASTGIATVLLSSTTTVPITAGSTATITATAVPAAGGSFTGSTTVSFTSGPISSAPTVAPTTATTMSILGSLTVTATVKDTNLNPISGATVTFSLSNKAGFVISTVTYNPSITSSATTGSDGKATATLTASIASGTLIVSAVAGGYNGTSAVITISGGDATKISGGTPSPSVIAANATAATPSTIVFTLQDTYGNTVYPAAAIPVTVTTTGGTFVSTGTATTTDIISTSTGATSATGIRLISTTTAGPVTVTATGGGLSGSVTVTFGGLAQDFTLSASPTTLLVGAAYTSAITIQLVDASGNKAVAPTGISVITTSATAGTAGAATAVSVYGTKTTFTYTAPTTIPPGGTALISVAVTIATGITVTHTVSIKITNAPNTIVITPDTTTAPADGTTITKITAKLVDSSGTTVVYSPTGQTIQFSTTAGTFLVTSTTTSATTGIATVYIRSPSTVGVATITAIGGGVIGSTSFNFTTPGTVYTETIAAPAVKDTAGNVVSAPTVGTVVTVASTIRNTKTTAQATLYIVQVKDSTGAVVYLSFVSGTIPASTSLELGVGWTPTAAGTYTIQVFAWDGWTTANPQAATQTITVTVA